MEDLWQQYLHQRKVEGNETESDTSKSKITNSKTSKTASDDPAAKAKGNNRTSWFSLFRKRKKQREKSRLGQPAGKPRRVKNVKRKKR